MGYKTITQIVLAIVALVIIFAYIQPTLISIRKTQDELFQYSDAANKAIELNQRLLSLVAVEESFKTSDKIALDEYLPSTIDDMAIMADIAVMAERSGVQLVSLSSGELELPVEDALFEGRKVETPKTTHIDFELQINGYYKDFKTMLQFFEENKYQLEITTLSFGEFIAEDIAIINPEESLKGDYQITLRAYAYSHAGN